MQSLTTCTLGFPRMGPNRELKALQERLWSKKITEEAFTEGANAVEKQVFAAQSAGIDQVGVDNGLLYDAVLDAVYTFSLTPERFLAAAGPAPSPLKLMFAMARGLNKAHALDMSKWFDTNYHFLRPELGSGTAPKLAPQLVLDRLARAQAELGPAKAVPILVGPATLVALATVTDDAVTRPELLLRLVPAYCELLQLLGAQGARTVQLLEPALCLGAAAAGLRPAVEFAYAAFHKVAAAGGPALHLVTSYDDLGENYEWAVRLPVATISLDFCGTPGALPGARSLELVKKFGFPNDKVLGAGVICGRSVFSNFPQAVATLAVLLGPEVGIPPERLLLHPSTSLLHLPWDDTVEGDLGMPAEVRARLTFALRKLQQLRDLAALGPSGICAQAAGTDPATLAPRDVPIGSLAPELFRRSEPFAVRRDKQWHGPAFPTSTIGSFPQTALVRSTRRAFEDGRIDAAEYGARMRGLIAHAIGVQEGLGLDVLVHGEAERSDMVYHFAQHLTGVAHTQHAWVQSYGSRCVRPPIIYGDVTRPAPMTVEDYKWAQQLTPKPVKGMLTGPVTLLQWSFPRTDISKRAQAFQLAQAVRAEVQDLEAAGCAIIQVDEPALREGLPLKQDRWAPYLAWAVDAFLLTTAGVRPETQIVSHLCYSDFGDIVEAIDRMDCDVLTVENARSDDAMIKTLAAFGYAKDLGPGVYDVHSPIVPSVEEMVDKVRGYVRTGILAGRLDRLWLVPDCGLKTRRWEEVLPSLRNMVQAAEELRRGVAEVGGGEGRGAVAEPAAEPGTRAGGGGGGHAERACCCHEMGC